MAEQTKELTIEEILKQLTAEDAAALLAVELEVNNGRIKCHPQMQYVIYHTETGRLYKRYQRLLAEVGKTTMLTIDQLRFAFYVNGLTHDYS